MSTSTDFLNTADAAAALMECMMDAAERQSRREQIPSLLELQTICRESGCDMPELNIFARLRDERPALLLCGGTAEMAQDLAKQLGYKLELPELPDTSLVWCIDSAEKAGFTIRYAGTERAMTRRMLTSFLQNDLRLTDLMLIEEKVKADLLWRFVWLPKPQYLLDYEQSATWLEILLGQQAAVTVQEDTPEPVVHLLQSLEQKWWPIASDQWQEEKPRATLQAGVTSLLSEPEETRELRAIYLWQFVSARLLEELACRKRDYQIAIDQQEQKLKSLRQLLGQYQRNWTSGVRSVTESYMQQRVTGRNIQELLEPQKPGPDLESFVAAISVPTLQSKIEQFVTDRMVDFVAGLEGLAAKMELRRIPLGEANARWNPRIGTLIEARLKERKIFADGAGKRSGLMAKVTGKTHAIVDHRRGQIGQASREVTQVIHADFTSWCGDFMTTLERNIRLQLTAALVNQGLPDAEGLRAALEGFERLSERIRHHRDSTRASEHIAAEWLRLLATRRWIPLFQGR